MILLLYTLFALDFLKGSIEMPIFTKHVLSLGGSNAFIGLIGTSTALLSFTWKPIAGRLSDSIGTQKILPWLLLMTAVGYIVLGFSTSLFVIFIGKLLCVFGAPVQALLNTVLTSLKKEERSKVLNEMHIIISLALMTGALIGGFLGEKGVIHGYLLGAAVILFSIVLVKQLPSNNPQEKPEEPKPTQNFLENIKSTLSTFRGIILSERYWDIFVIKGCLGAMYSIVQANFIYILTVEYSLSGRQMGYVMTFFSLCGITTNFIVMKLNKIIYPDDNNFTKLIHGALLMTLSHLGIYSSSSFNVYLFFSTFASIARNLMEPAVMGVMLVKIEENKKGTVMSSFDSMRSLIEIVVPVLRSVVVEALGPKGVFLCAALLSAVVLSISVKRKNKL